MKCPACKEEMIKVPISKALYYTGDQAYDEAEIRDYYGCEPDTQVNYCDHGGKFDHRYPKVIFDDGTSI